MQREDEDDSHEVMVTEKVEEGEREQEFETNEEFDTDDEMPELVDMDYGKKKVYDQSNDGNLKGVDSVFYRANTGELSGQLQSRSCQDA